MTQETITTAASRAAGGFTAEHFAAFWANPDPAMLKHAVAADAVGHWPGGREPVRGVAEYAQAIADLLALIPDLRLEVLESATKGDLLFIRWRGRGTGANGRFEMTGIDRIRVRDGLVSENVIVFDTAEFEARAGHPWPPAGR